MCVRHHNQNQIHLNHTYRQEGSLEDSAASGSHTSWKSASRAQKSASIISVSHQSDITDSELSLEYVSLLEFQPKYVCTAPPPLTDGSYRITGHGSDAFGYTPTSTAIYDCDKNLPGLTLRLEGSVLSECKDDGTWSDVKRECVVSGELSTG